VIDLGVKHGFVDKSGAWYAYQGTKIGQGKANAAKYLEEHPEIATEVEAAIREKLLAVVKPKVKEEQAEAEPQLDL